MRIGIAQINCTIGVLEQNSLKIINVINSLKDKVDLVVFPELILSGYPPEDVLFWNNYWEKINQQIKKISEASSNINVILGTPFYDENNKKWKNAAILLQNHQIKHIWTKTLLPNYDVFYENRYFEPGNPSTFIVNGRKISTLICEDIWNTQNLKYSRDPIQEIKNFNPDILIVISASPFSKNHLEKRLSIAQNIAKSLNVPLLYVNQVGAHTEIVFDGGSFLVNGKGEIVKILSLFKESIEVIDIDNIQPTEVQIPPKIQRIKEALILGIRDFLAKQNIKKAIVSISGGVDSSVVLALATESLGKENVIPVFMPSQFTSDASISGVKKLIKNLNYDSYIEIPINEIYNEYLKNLEKNIPNDITLPMENLQARIRANIIMYLANKYSAIVLNSSNKSELATGYGTIYGDLIGGLSVLGDVYKTEVYQLAHLINSEREHEVIPQEIIERAPSAELKPNQKDEDTLPPYPILDQILQMYIENKNSIEEIKKAGFDHITIEKVINMIEKSEHKRYQAPPVIRVSDVAWGKGWKMPIVGIFPK